MEIDFCRARFIHGLFLKFNFCLKIFFKGEYISKIELKLVRILMKNWSTFPLTDLIKFCQSTDMYSKMKFSWSNLDQSLSKILNFVDDGLEKMSREMRDLWRWSDIVEVKLPILFLILFGGTIGGLSIWRERESQGIH